MGIAECKFLRMNDKYKEITLVIVIASQLWSTQILKHKHYGHEHKTLRG